MSEGSPEGKPRVRFGLWAGRIVVTTGRVMASLLPRRLREALDDRFFGAVFQVTRVTNDAYGWRPETTGGTGDASTDEPEIARPAEGGREPPVG